MKIFKQAILPAMGMIVLLSVAILPAQDAATNAAVDFPPGEGIRLDFHDAPLDDVLSYLSRAAGFVIYLRPGVRVDGTVTVRSEQPLSQGEAVNLPGNRPQRPRSEHRPK